jgi:hypothetical protein
LDSKNAFTVMGEDHEKNFNGKGRVLILKEFFYPGFFI